jgi:hypothetical protein
MAFDLMVFSDERDYLCYVEAVELLRVENKKQECDFIHNKKVFRGGMYEVDIADDTFLKLENRAKEHFFIIDNTEYPEAVLDSNWIQTPPDQVSSADHLFVDVNITTTYTSNDKFYFWNWIFIILIGTLGSILGLTILCYCCKVRKYNNYVSERRILKKELLKIKDTEYTNYLMRASENLKK